MKKISLFSFVLALLVSVQFSFADFCVGRDKNTVYLQTIESAAECPANYEKAPVWSPEDDCPNAEPSCHNVVELVLASFMNSNDFPGSTEYLGAATVLELESDLDFGGLSDGSCVQKFFPLSVRYNGKKIEKIEGNNHTISGLCFIYDQELEEGDVSIPFVFGWDWQNETYVNDRTSYGFIDTLDGVQVSNLTFDGAYIYGLNQEVGVVAGHSNGSTFSNVTVKNSNVHGRVAGSIIGGDYKSSFSNVTASGNTIRVTEYNSYLFDNDGRYPAYPGEEWLEIVSLGGIAGYMNNTTVDNYQVSNVVVENNTISNGVFGTIFHDDGDDSYEGQVQSYLGGVVGRFISGFNGGFNDVVVRGGSISNGTYMGAVAGDVYAGCYMDANPIVVENVSVQGYGDDDFSMELTNSNGSRCDIKGSYVGGLFGNVSGSSCRINFSLKNSSYRGNISLPDCGSNDDFFVGGLLGSVIADTFAIDHNYSYGDIFVGGSGSNYKTGYLASVIASGSRNNNQKIVSNYHYSPTELSVDALSGNPTSMVGLFRGPDFNTAGSYLYNFFNVTENTATHVGEFDKGLFGVNVGSELPVAKNEYVSGDFMKTKDFAAYMNYAGDSLAQSSRWAYTAGVNGDLPTASAGNVGNSLLTVDFSFVPEVYNEQGSDLFRDTYCLDKNGKKSFAVVATDADGIIPEEFIDDLLGLNTEVSVTDFQLDDITHGTDPRVGGRIAKSLFGTESNGQVVMDGYKKFTAYAVRSYSVSYEYKEVGRASVYYSIDFMAGFTPMENMTSSDPDIVFPWRVRESYESFMPNDSLYDVVYVYSAGAERQLQRLSFYNRCFEDSQGGRTCERDESNYPGAVSEEWEQSNVLKADFDRWLSEKELGGNVVLMYVNKDISSRLDPEYVYALNEGADGSLIVSALAEQINGDEIEVVRISQVDLPAIGDGFQQYWNLTTNPKPDEFRLEAASRYVFSMPAGYALEKYSANYYVAIKGNQTTYERVTLTADQCASVDALVQKLEEFFAGNGSAVLTIPLAANADSSTVLNLDNVRNALARVGMWNFNSGSYPQYLAVTPTFRAFNYRLAIDFNKSNVTNDLDNLYPSRLNNYDEGLLMVLGHDRNYNEIKTGEKFPRAYFLYDMFYVITYGGSSNEYYDYDYVSNESSVLVDGFPGPVGTLESNVVKSAGVAENGELPVEVAWDISSLNATPAAKHLELRPSCADDESSPCTYTYMETDNTRVLNSMFHGGVKLVQYDNETDDVLTENDVTYREYFVRGQSASSSAFFMPLPNENDTLTFAVYANPDPGYDMKVKGFSLNEITSTDVECQNQGDGWGLILPTSENGNVDTLLRVNPFCMDEDMYLKAEYVARDYKFRYAKFSEAKSASDAVKAFFEWDHTSGDYIPWNKEFTVSVASSDDDRAFPRVYASQGCVIWNLDGNIGYREGSSDGDPAYTGSELNDLLDYEEVDILKKYDGTENGYVNTLYPYFARERGSCVDSEKSSTVTLHSDGRGTVKLVQYLGAKDTTSSQFFDRIEHGFDVVQNASSGQDTVLNIPWRVAFGESEPITMSFVVEVVPDEGYRLEKVWYEVNVLNNKRSMVMFDGDTIIVDGDRELFVKFRPDGPYYVKYDLALGEGDSGKVYIPTNAVDNDTLDRALFDAAANDTVELWQPYRTDKCFAGWTMLNPDGDEETVTKVAFDQLAGLSISPESPSLLKAAWKNPGVGCVLPSGNSVVTLKPAAQDENVELVVSQFFGKDSIEFRHEVSLTGEKIAVDAEYQIFVKAAAELGFSATIGDGDVKKDGEALTASVDDGSYTIGGVADAGKTVSVAWTKEQIPYNLVFNNNTQEKVVYGTADWYTHRSVAYGADDELGGLIRKDACFVGWSATRDGDASSAVTGKLSDHPEFLESLLQVAEENGSSELQLYAVWNNAGTDCPERGYDELVMFAYPSSVGAVEVYQMVDESVVVVDTIFGMDSGYTAVDNALNAYIRFVPGTIFDEYLEFSQDVEGSDSLCMNMDDGFASQYGSVYTTYKSDRTCSGNGSVFDILKDESGIYNFEITLPYLESKKKDYQFVFNPLDEVLVVDGDGESPDLSMPVFYISPWTSAGKDGGYKLVSNPLSDYDSYEMLKSSEGVQRAYFCAEDEQRGAAYLWSFEKLTQGLPPYQYSNVYGYFTPAMLAEIAERKSQGLQTDTLYAVWNGSAEDGRVLGLNGCHGIASSYAEVALSESIRGKAKVAFVQEVEGVDSVVAVLSGDQVMGIPLQATNNYVMNFSKLQLIPEPGYVLDENSATTLYYSYDDGNRSPIDDDLQVRFIEASGYNSFTAKYGVPQWPITDEAATEIDFNLRGSSNPSGRSIGVVYLAADLVENVYTFDFNVNVPENTTVFYKEDWTDSKTFKMGDAASARVFPTASRNDACFAGWSWKQTAENDETFESIDGDFVTAYDAAPATDKSYSGDGTPVLYAIWKNAGEDGCTVDFVTISSSVPNQGVFNLSRLGENYEILGEGLKVPANAGYSFTLVDFTPNPGYAYVDNSMNLPEGSLIEVVADDISLTASVLPVPVDFVFDVNSTDTVFYGASWKFDSTYDVTMSEAARSFPTAIYRTSACLAGWSWDKAANAANALSVFDESFLTSFYAAAEAEESVVDSLDDIPVLYAIWKTDGCDLTNYTVASTNADVGTLVLSLTTADGNTFDYRVNADGTVSVPSKDDLSFNLSFIANDGHSVSQSGSYYTMDEDDNKIAKIANKVISITSDTRISAPVTLDGLEFVFDANGGESNVFYGSDWVASREFNMAADEADRQFPAGLYRSDAVFEGWALTPGATKTFDIYDESFLNAVQTAKDGGFDVSTLYAVWNTSASGIESATITNNSADYGSLILTRTVGVESWSDTVDNVALSVPTSVPMDFVVSFRLKPGFKYTGNGSVNFTNAAGESVAVVNNTISVSENLFAEVEAGYDSYTFALAENAVNKNIFVSGDYSNTLTLTLDGGNKTLPTGIYRTDACLEGWALTANGSPYTVFDTTFVNAYNAKALADGVAPNTLYAVWDESCSQTTVVVHADVRTVDTLAQANGHAFEIPAEGLLVPAQNLTFDVRYATKLGYKVDATSALKALDGEGGSEIASAVTGNELTVGQSLWISAPVEVVDSRMVFKPNAGNDKVFYGNSWTADTIVYNMDMASDSRDFFSAVYRVGYRFNGWKLSTLSGQKTYSKFDEELVEDLGTATNATLYADWVLDANVAVDTIVNYSADAGKLLLMSLKGGNVLDTFVVVDTLIVPAGLGDIEFNLAFDANVGYEIDEDANFYGVDAAGKNKMILSASQQAFVANTSVKAPVYALAYTFAFKEGSADDTVFYANGWFTTKGYDMSMDEASRMFPTGIYQVGKTLAGWSLVDGGTAFTAFDASFVEALLSMEVVPDTLVAVWEADATTPIVVTNRNPAAGKLLLKQNVGRTSATFEVGEDGLRIPNVDGGLNFVASYEAKSGYTVGSPLFTIVNVAANDSSTAENNSSVVIASNTVFGINVDAARSYEFAFNVNTADTNVFYGNNWVSSETLKLGDENAFPMVYVADRCLVGWSLSTNATTGSMEFDDALYSSMTSSQKTGNGTLSLYAVWGECPTTRIVANVQNGNAAAGVFKLTRTVGGQNKSYTVGAAGLRVPTDEVLTFGSVEFVRNPGYSFNAETGISSSVENAYVDGVLEVSESMTLSVDAEAIPYEFALVENAGTSMVFVADDFVSSITVTMDDADKSFPMGIYRSDACIEGWALSADGIPFNGLDADLIAAYDSVTAANGVAPNQLFAIWNDRCRQTLFTVYSENEGEGTFTLSQSNGHSYDVPDVGLKIPSVGDGLNFAVSFRTERGYKLNESAGLAVMDMQGSVYATADDGLVVDQNLMLYATVIPTSSVFAFDANAEGDSVFYGASWKFRQTFDISESEDARTFPAAIYRNDVCFAGWAFTKDATTGYTLFDADFVDAMNALATVPSTLYAVWSTQCSTTPTSYVVTSASLNAGDMSLELVADGRKFSYPIPAEGLKVPAGMTDVTFSMNFVQGFGYTLDATGSYSEVNESGEVLTRLTSGKLQVLSDKRLMAPVKADTYQFVFDVNADEVFYGTGWSKKAAFDLSMSESKRTLPANIYRVGYKLKGWKLYESGAEYLVFDDELVADIHDELFATNADTITMQAVWVSDATEPYVVTNGTVFAGSLMLSQVVDGDILPFTVPDSGLKVPAVQDGLEFTATFVPKNGYELSSTPLSAKVVGGSSVNVTSNGRVVVDNSLVFTANYNVGDFEFVYNANSNGADVFLGNAWKKSGKFSLLDDDNAFPTNIYRADACIDGWSLDPLATSGMKNFDDDFYATVEAALSENKSVDTLYAVWSKSCKNLGYAIVLNENIEEGELTLSRTVDNVTLTYTVGESGLKVPTAEILSFKATFVPKTGYIFSKQDPLFARDAAGGEVNLDNNQVTVNAPVSLGAAIAVDGFTFALNTNAGDARLFYGNGWASKGYFSVDNNAVFPTNLYRTDACLKGWALAANGGQTFTKYDSSFVETLRQFQSLGLPTGTLFAVWDSYCADNYTLTSKSDRNGSFEIFQVVEGSAMPAMKVNSQGVDIPVSATGLAFVVKFTENPGYTLKDGESLFLDVGNSVNAAVENGGTLVVAANSALRASVNADEFKFAYDVNGGDSYVYYGEGWKRTGKMTLDDEAVALPMDIYRADAKLVGWSLDEKADVTKAYVEFTPALAAEILDDTVENTLYAVWDTTAEIEVYTVTFAEAEIGSLTLSQVADDEVKKFEVPQAGLPIPLVQGGLKFKASYVLAGGYSAIDADSLYVVDENGLVGPSLVNGDLLVDKDVELTVPTEAEVYNIVFNKNTSVEPVFYGSDWLDSSKFVLGDENTVLDLPMLVYSTTTCVVGWALKPAAEEGDSVFTKFNSNLADAFKAGGERSDRGTYVMYAVWGDAEQCVDYNKIQLASENGSIVLEEVSGAADAEPIEHKFAEDGTILLPKIANGLLFSVRSIPDSSYMLDSLVVTRIGDDEFRHVALESGSLPRTLYNTEFKAYFGKANHTPLEFVKADFVQSGNAIRFSFTTSDFEVTRGASLSAVVIDSIGTVVVDTVFADSIPSSFESSWDLFPVAVGSYSVEFSIFDDRESFVFDTSFAVVSEVAAVLADGWQMISLAAIDTGALVWDDDAQFYWWDESTVAAEFWQYRAFERGDEIVKDRGFWFSSLQGRTVPLRSDYEDDNSDVVWKLDSLNSGWNLVANPHGWAMDLFGDKPADKVDGNEEAPISFWKYDALAADYIEVETIGPYEAVWVKVSGPTEWTVPSKPIFKADAVVLTDSVGTDSLGTDTLGGSALEKSRALAKAASADSWSLQMVLKDGAGRTDAWNMLGVSNKPFTAEEPPASLGNHVSLSIMDGNRALAKSVKAPASENEWKVALSATSNRRGFLSFKGVSEIRQYGYKVFVTIDGKTSEVGENEELDVSLTTRAKYATVRVAPTANTVVVGEVRNLRAAKVGRELNVSFIADKALAGAKTRVDLMDMKGHVIATVNAKAVAGTNKLAFEAPKTGLYMLRVRAGSQMSAGKVVVK